MTQSKPICQAWFTTRKVGHALFLVNEMHYWEWNRANIWLIKGRRQDVLFDTGLGVASLRRHLAELIDGPLLAISSHIHFDHAGGIHEFDRIAIHAAEADALRRGDGHTALCEPASRWIRDEHFEQLPSVGFRADKYVFHSAEPTQILQDNDIVDLGNRTLRVLHLPGHSPGSIALYDEKSRELFSGDAIYDGELCDQLPGSDVDHYIASFERLRELAVEKVYPGHNQIFGKGRYRQIISEYLASAQERLQRPRESMSNEKTS
jgi:glyoxylase-like metal-dependent hydrolase (beta-lactamase superfamily II)